jgi:hypothetical protein
MFDAKFWGNVQTNYPKTYRELIIFNYSYLKDKRFDVDFHYDIFENDRKDICYCDLEKFFDGLGIMLTIYVVEFYRQNRFTFTYEIYTQKEVESSCIRYNSRSEAELAAVNKAFEIKEKQLETENGKK